MGVRALIRTVVERLFPKTLEKSMGVEVTLSNQMVNALQLWREMYDDEHSWGGKGFVSTNIPASIAEELTGLVLTEFKIEVNGGVAGAFINQELQRELRHLDASVEEYCALGGIVVKPYVIPNADGRASHIAVDWVDADHFYPLEYDKKKITSGIFLEHKRIGQYTYTRAEYHQFDSGTLTITNRVFRSRVWLEGQDGIGAESLFNEEVSLSVVPEWAFLSKESVVIHGLDEPLFCYIRVPQKNHIDSGSPLGPSVYAGADTMIRQADEQMEAIIHEYTSKRAKLFVSRDLLPTRKGGILDIPQDMQDVFMTFEDRKESGKNFLDAFSPEFRDTALWNGFNKFLRRIEWNVGLAYGTISDPEAMEKTATEIKMSQQRSYRTVSRMQVEWKDGLQHLVWAMHKLAQLYGLCPAGEIEVTCTFGDGVLEDTDKEFARRMTLASAGILRNTLVSAWYFGCEEESAKQMLPDSVEEDPPHDGD